MALMHPEIFCFWCRHILEANERDWSCRSGHHFSQLFITQMEAVRHLTTAFSSDVDWPTEATA